MGENGSDKPLVFVSYSHQDEAWKDKLRPHLKALEVTGRVVVWDDRRIDGGEVWYDEIRANMEKAGVAVCLISKHFLASEFCIKEEVAHFIRQRRDRGMAVIPVLVSPCFWEMHDWLAQTQLIPRDGKCLTLDYPDEAAQDAILLTVARTIFEIISDPGYQAPPVQPSAYPPLPENLIDIERLPVTGAELFGRQDELQALDESWEAENINVVSLVGWGGVGKSTLLNKWIASLAADNFRGARRTFAWSFYSQGTNERVTSADAFVDEALRFFGEGEPSAGSPWARGEQLATLVGREKALLLLDGMEPLQDRHQGIKDPALVRLIECLAIKNEGLCVITTREPIKEFFEFPDTTRQVNLERLSPDAGRALLRVKGVRGSDAELEAASAAFGNHALAIMLLASFLWGCEGKHIRNASEISDLTDLDDDNHRHSRRVMAALAERFGDGPELDLLHIMGLFDRPADGGCLRALRAAPAIPGLTGDLSKLGEAGWLKLLENLRNIGLLAPASHHDSEELDAHPLVREHFGARLRDERFAAWQAGHLRLYKHFRTAPKEHRPKTLVEMVPLFQAVYHGCSAGRNQEVLFEVYEDRLMRDSEYFLTSVLGAHNTSLQLISNIIGDDWRNRLTAIQEEDHASLLNSYAYSLRSQGNLRDAILPTDEARSIAVNVKDWRNAATRASLQSELYLLLGDISLAGEFASESLCYAERSGDQVQEINSMTTLAYVELNRGAFERALRIFREAERIQNVIEVFRPRPRLHRTNGQRYLDLLLDLERASEVNLRCLLSMKWRSQCDPIMIAALDYVFLGLSELSLNEYEKAEEKLNEGVEILRLSGSLHRLPHGLLARAALFVKIREFRKARDDLREVMRLVRRSELRLFQCDAHLEYTRLALAEGKRDDARAHLKSAASLVSDCGYHRRDGEVTALERALA